MRRLQILYRLPAVLLITAMLSVYQQRGVSAKDMPSSRQTSDIKATFVELGSVNCIPCKAMQPVMKEIEQKYRGQVNVVFHDVWTEEGRAYGDQYKVRAIPTQVFLDKDGKEFYRHVGFFPAEAIAKVLEKQGIIANEADRAKTQKKKNGDKVQSGQVCK